MPLKLLLQIVCRGSFNIVSYSALFNIQQWWTVFCCRFLIRIASSIKTDSKCSLLFWSSEMTYYMCRVKSYERSLLNRDFSKFQYVDHIVASLRVRG